MTENNKSNNIEYFNRPNLGRIVFSSLGYAVLGSLAPDYEAVALGSLGLGAILSSYDEITKKGLDLSTPAVSALLGGFVGSLFDTNYFSELYSHGSLYTGAAVGFTLGMYNSYRKRNK